MSKEPIVIPVLVAATDSNGAGTFFPVKIVCSQEQYELGEHYETAKTAARYYLYEPNMCVDAVECRTILTMDGWQHCPYFDIAGNKTDLRPGVGPELGGHHISLMELDALHRSNPYGEHRQHPRSAWQCAAHEGDTQLGYWAWVRHNLEAALCA